jgi:hypothetical protein
MFLDGLFDVITEQQTQHVSCEAQVKKVISLTQSNMVDLAVQFYNQHNLSNQDLVETIQAMLESKRYRLGQEVTQNKLDFTEANALFLSSVAPSKLDKKDLQNLIFKNVVCDSLI